jgi:hypothetical protein
MIRPTASLSTLSRTTFASWCRKRLFLSHVHIEPIVLPRQARDKHEQTLKKRGGFSPPQGFLMPPLGEWKSILIGIILNLSMSMSLGE